MEDREFLYLFAFCCLLAFGQHIHTRHLRQHDEVLEQIRVDLAMTATAPVEP